MSIQIKRITRAAQAAFRLGATIALFTILPLGLPACETAPASTPTLPVPTATSEAPTPAPTFTVAARPPEPTPTPTVQKPLDKVNKEAIKTDWETMFRETNGYEYVSTDGQPGKKDWWVKQTKQFYTGQALRSRLDHIDYMFSPNVLGKVTPAFIEGARYTVEVETCSSDTECTLKITLHEGTFWAYDLRAKSWQKATPIDPITWPVVMRYDGATKRWKLKEDLGP